MTSDSKFPLLEQCRNITSEFVSNPISFPFRKPFNQKDLIEDYKAKILRPMDLETVQKRINNHNYLNFQQWADDMTLIFSNAVQYNSKDNIIGGCAIYLQKKLDKKIQKLQASNQRNYEAQLQKLIIELNEVLVPPPSYSIEQQIDMSVPEIMPFTIERMTKLKDNLNQCVEKGLTLDILKVLQNTMPELKEAEELTINISELGKSTLLDLENFVKEKKL